MVSSLVSPVLAFSVAAVILTMTPGLDTAMVLRSAAVDGSRRAALAAAGIALGCLAWGAAAAVGLGALLAASEAAYATLKWAGALYLLWLGVRLILRPRTVLADPSAGPLGEGGSSDAFWRGFATNMLNPKVGVFYVTFLPQFVPAGAPVATFTFMLALIHVALGLVWFGLLIAATTPLRRLLSRGPVVKWLDRVTGVVFIGFGLRLALTRP
ncbi:LysE family translocator [Alsobacter sp. R-9]